MFNPTRLWYAKSLQFPSLILLPFSWMFRLGVKMRRACYRMGIFKSHCFSVPIIVVGNITVGGTGKTPFVISLATFLQTHGYRPGIVSRGIGGIKHKKPHRVSKEDAPSHVGDEAILLATHARCPVVIGINRSDAVKHLLHHADCNIVISDDGLQHYRMQRDIEIVMVDGERHFGNQQLLPAGPLREPLARLDEVDFVVTNSQTAQTDFMLTLEPMGFVSLKDAEHIINPTQFAQTVHAVAGIGHPERFFAMLRSLGLTIIPHVFPDHYLYQQKDLEFNDELPIVMTEKDAVKCRTFADKRYWFLAVKTKISNRLEEKLLKKLQSLEVGHVEDFASHVDGSVFNQCNSSNRNNNYKRQTRE